MRRFVVAATPTRLWTTSAAALVRCPRVLDKQSSGSARESCWPPRSATAGRDQSKESRRPCSDRFRAASEHSRNCLETGHHARRQFAGPPRAVAARGDSNQGLPTVAILRARRLLPALPHREIA